MKGGVKVLKGLENGKIDNYFEATIDHLENKDVKGEFLMLCRSRSANELIS